jgi:hypothetical protein
MPHREEKIEDLSCLIDRALNLAKSLNLDLAAYLLSMTSLEIFEQIESGSPKDPPARQS